MKTKLLSFLALIVLMLPCSSKAECKADWEGQCSYFYLTSCGTIELLTLPCEWLLDSELRELCEFDVEMYICD